MSDELSGCISDGNLYCSTYDMKSLEKLVCNIEHNVIALRKRCCHLANNVHYCHGRSHDCSFFVYPTGEINRCFSNVSYFFSHTNRWWQNLSQIVSLKQPEISRLLMRDNLHEIFYAHDCILLGNVG